MIGDHQRCAYGAFLELHLEDFFCGRFHQFSQQPNNAYMVPSTARN